MSPPDVPSRTIEPDLAALGERVGRAAQAWAPGAAVVSIRRLAGGASSLTYLAELAGASEPRAVVKVAPAGLPATRHRDMLRQARLLQSLGGRDDLPVPRVLFVDRAAGGGTEGGDLFGMSWCDGESVEPTIDEQPSAIPGAAELEGRVRHAARVLARLHAPETLQPWIADEPLISLAEEIERWDRALATVPAEFGLDWEGTSRLLHATVPAPVSPRLTHGDYRLGNLLCQGSAVIAVLDWEIWSVSDGRVDLGWFLLTLDASHPAAVRAADGMPARDAVLAEYAAAGGLAVDDVNWFLALALYKFTATTGLIGKHALRRGDVSSWGTRMVPRLPGTLARIGDLVGAR